MRATEPESVRTDFTVTDMGGREVLIPAEVKTIATFGSVGVLNAFVELMGCGGRLCAEMPKRFQSGSWAMQYEFAPQIKGAPQLVNDDGELLMEEILKLAPDLCVTMTKETADLLGEQGLACVYLEWRQNNDVKTAVELMGRVLNKEDIAEDYLVYFDGMVMEAETLTLAIPEAERKTVLYGNITKLTQPHIIAEWWIKEAGSISVTDNGRTQESLEYTQEELLLWNPDVMIVSNRKMIEELKADPLYADFKAVKVDAIHIVFWLH